MSFCRCETELKLSCFVVIELKSGKYKAEYALRDINKATVLAEYRITERLSENLKTALPTIEKLEAKLSQELELVHV